MTAFWLISALLMIGALLFVVLPMLAGGKGARFSRSAANISIHRDQLRELKADRDSGALDAEQYEKARRELEARLLEDLREGDAAPKSARHGRAGAVAAGVAIPLLAVALYFLVGNPQAITGEQAAGGVHDTSPQQVEVLVGQLAARMARNPEDVEGWTMLGRSYQALGRFGESAQAFANAVARSPADAGLLADYALVLAATQDRRLQGEPQKLLARALEADPDNVKALALAGSAAFQNQDYAGAISHWQRMVPLVPQDSDTARVVQERIAEARSRSGEAGELQPPKSLGGLELLHASQGKEALEEINRLHGKELSAKGGYVAHYEKNGAAAMLYLAQASSTDDAARQLNQMSARIRRGDTPFNQLTKSRQGEITVYSALGQGQRHYFYRRDASVLWLAADAAVAKQSLAALVAQPINPSRAAKRSQE
jgi:cytochrome c-type biogenesis protein CcmH